MSVTTKTVWNTELSETQKAKWDLLKSDWLSSAVDSGKTDGTSDSIKGGGTRVWKDQKSADEWKELVESASKKLGIDVKVTFE